MASEEATAPVVEESRRRKVVILGGGMAGLSAASHLIHNDLTDFLIIESRNRLGGRIVSIQTDGAKLELGANWIHGVLGNPIYELAMSHGLVNIVQTPRPHKVVASTEEGRQVPFALLHEVYEAYMCFLHRCEEYFLCQYMPPQGIESVGEHIELEIALYLDRQCVSLEEKRVRRLIFDCLLKRETCISGCSSMSEIDLLELGSYTELQGGNIVLPSGYSSILGPMTKDIPKENIVFRERVLRVEWGGGAVAAEEDGEGGDDCFSSGSDDTVTEVPRNKDEEAPQSKVGVTVTCASGTTYTADHVICTLPLGVLKAEASSLFSPPLPEYKLEAIQRLLFGTVDKIFLVYERPFLNQDISEVMLLWNYESSSKDNLSDVWYKKIYSFSKVTETILLGWVSGQEAEYMETLTDEQVSDKCTEILRKFLNDPFIPKPKKCIRTHWFSEPNTRGSYTSIGVGATQADIQAIAQPLYSDVAQTKPAVLFAGEHTHTSFYSTVHGAYLTGRTCAQALLESFQPPEEFSLECEGTSDLSSWIQGISLDEPS